jgi:hypothetical protein
LDVAKEAFVVEHTADVSVEPMDSWVVCRHFLAGETLPESDDRLLPGARLSWSHLPLEYPSVASFAISTNANIRVETESKE